GSEEVAEGQVDIDRAFGRGPDIEAEQELVLPDAQPASGARVEIEEVAVVAFELPDPAGVDEADEPEGDDPIEDRLVEHLHSQFRRGQGFDAADEPRLGQPAHAALAADAFDRIDAAGP